MANKRPPHRKGTTGHAYRQARTNQLKRSNTCARCGGSCVKQKCDPTKHPTHAKLPYCPTHPLAPSLGHKTDLQFGGAVLDPRNHQTEHYGCNSSAGVKARMDTERATKKGHQHQPPRESWDW